MLDSIIINQLIEKVKINKLMNNNYNALLFIVYFN